MMRDAPDPAASDEKDRPTAEVTVQATTETAPDAGGRARALRFTHGLGTSGPTPVWIDLSRTNSLRSKDVPTAYVLTEHDVVRLPTDVKRHQPKHKEKSLESYMRKDKVPSAITYYYTSSVRLKRGVRALLCSVFRELTGATKADVGVKTFVATALDGLAGKLEDEVRQALEEELDELASDTATLDKSVGTLLEGFSERRSRTGKLGKSFDGLLKSAFGNLDTRLGKLFSQAVTERMSDTGRLEASVKEMLETSVKEEHERRKQRPQPSGAGQPGPHEMGLLYFVGVQEWLFDKVWNASGPKAPSSDVANEPVSSRLLLDVIERADVPDVPAPPNREEQDLGGTPEQIVMKRFVGKSLETRLVRQLILRAARTTDPVLILGETGTGKEATARAIHDASPRKQGPFIAANCAAIPTELFESEMFGVMPEAGVGVPHGRDGLWKMADGGTLFLDELGDLALHHQGKILRALEDGAIRPVGWPKPEPLKVDARVLAATNRDIIAQVRTGRFREDLYYRLRPFLIRTTPLRDHPDDIPDLATWFWRNKICGEASAELHASVLEEMKLHSWPGNAREVKAILMSMRSLFGTRDLRAKHLRAVFHLEGHVLAQSPSSARRLSSPMARAMDRLKHLGLVDDALRATRESLNRDPYGSRAFLGRHREELDPLMQEDLFARKESWTLVDVVRSRLAAGPEEPLEPWRLETIAACDAALAALDQDAQVLVDPDLHVGP